MHFFSCPVLRGDSECREDVPDCVVMLQTTPHPEGAYRKRLGLQPFQDMLSAYDLYYRVRGACGSALTVLGSRWTGSRKAQDCCGWLEDVLMTSLWVW